MFLFLLNKIKNFILLILLIRHVTYHLNDEHEDAMNGGTIIGMPFCGIEHTLKTDGNNCSPYTHCDIVGELRTNLLVVCFVVVCT